MRVKEIFDSLGVYVGIPVMFVEDGEAPAWVRIEDDGSVKLYFAEKPFLSLLSVAKCQPHTIMKILIQHEISHVLLDHFHNLFYKRKDFHHGVMNIAADAVINSGIPEIKNCFETFYFHEGWSSSKWKGIPLCTYNISAEDLYSLIISKYPSIKSNMVNGLVVFDVHKPSYVPVRKDIIDDLKRALVTLAGDQALEAIRNFFVKHHKIDWAKKVLNYAVSSSFRPTYKKPSRRNPDFPAMRMKTEFKITLLVDASGSVRDKALSKVAHFCKKVHKIAKLKIFSYDVKAYEVSISDIQKGRLVGGGGTNLENALKSVNISQDELLVIVTDGIDDFPEKLVPKNTFVVVYGRKNRFYQKALSTLGEGRVFHERI